MPRVLRDKKIIFASVLILTLCLYGWVTRELPLKLWLIARIFELDRFRSLLHPEYFCVASSETPVEAAIARREKVDAFMAMSARVLDGDMQEVHDVTLAVKGGEIPLRIYVPRSGTPGRSQAFRGVLVWLHGGGWMFGSVEATDGISKDLAQESEMIVVSVGYRLSPEVQFPVPVKDCLAAMRWVKKEIWTFGGDSTRLALVGESAGGNLALATALQMGRSWLPLLTKKSGLCAVVAASPPLSFEHAKKGSGEGDGEWRSYDRYDTGYGLEAAQMKGYWEAYLEKDRDGRRPLASPLRTPKRMLRGLPPVLLLRAEHEVLWDEISEMGRNLADAGQEVVQVQTQGCIHGMFAKDGGACGKASLEAAGRFLKERCV